MVWVSLVLSNLLLLVHLKCFLPPPSLSFPSFYIPVFLISLFSLSSLHKALIPPLSPPLSPNTETPAPALGAVGGTQASLLCLLSPPAPGFSWLLPGQPLGCLCSNLSINPFRSLMFIFQVEKFNCSSEREALEAELVWGRLMEAINSSPTFGTLSSASDHRGPLRGQPLGG